MEWRLSDRRKSSLKQHIAYSLLMVVGNLEYFNIVNLKSSLTSKSMPKTSKWTIIAGMKLKQELGLFGTLKLALALQFIVTNAYFSVGCNTKVSGCATLK